MASSLPRIRCEKLLNDSYESLGALVQIGISPSRRRMGKVIFASLRKIYIIIRNGGEIPKHNYTFCIDGSKVTHAIEFLQESLEIKSGCTRNVCVSGHMFQNISVYEWGGRTVDGLVEAYVKAVPTEECVGRQTFRDMIKLMTKRGETKAGVSTYYIRFRYSSNTFVMMMKRLDELEILSIIMSEVQSGVKNIVEEWKNIEQFLVWDYSANNLSLDDSDIAHCCQCALGGLCSRIHMGQSCQKCSSMVSFFDKPVKQLIQILSNNMENNTHSDEIKSMHGAITTLSDMLHHYMSHRLREKSTIQCN